MDVMVNKTRDNDVLVVVNVATKHIFMRHADNEHGYSMFDPKTQAWTPFAHGWGRLVQDGKDVSERISLCVGDSFTINL